jgi:hypothetical protein
MTPQQVTVAFDELSRVFQELVAAELENPKNPEGSQQFSGLLNLLHHGIWESPQSGRATTFDYSQAVKSPHFKNYMVGHHVYDGGSRVVTQQHGAFFQLDNKALQYGLLGEPSPVAISF